MQSTSATHTVRALMAAALLVTIAVTLPGASAASAQDVPRVLVYSGTQAYRHASINYGNPLLAALAEQTGAFTVDFTERPGDLTPRTLDNYDIVLFNSPSGMRTGPGDWPATTCQQTVLLCDRAPLSPEQREAFVDWMQCGGGVVGIHQVLDAWHDWPEWDEMTGMVFQSHYSNAEAQLFVTSEHPAARPFGVLGQMFLLADEFYTYTAGNGPRDLSSDVEVLLGIGTFTNPNVEASQGRYYEDQQPMAWTSTFRGQNRVFITVLGHNTTTWDKPAFLQHVLQGIGHVAGQRPDPRCVAAIPEPLVTYPLG